VLSRGYYESSSTRRAIVLPRRSFAPIEAVPKVIERIYQNDGCGATIGDRRFFYALRMKSSRENSGKFRGERRSFSSPIFAESANVREFTLRSGKLRAAVSLLR